jgi:hypothetical protein
MGYARSTVANCMPDLNDPTSSTSYRPAPTAPEHLNNTGCKIKYSEGKGRGVYGTSGLSARHTRASYQISIASKPMPAYTLLEINPALLFSAEEYEAHGRHTVLDHYTFKWRDGRMALALGLGVQTRLSISMPCFAYLISSAQGPCSIIPTLRTSLIPSTPPPSLLDIRPYAPLSPMKSSASTTAQTSGSNPLRSPTDVLARTLNSSMTAGAGSLPSPVKLKHHHHRTMFPRTRQTRTQSYRTRTSRSPGLNLPLTKTTKRHQRPSAQVSMSPASPRVSLCPIQVQAWAVDIPDPRHTTSALKYISPSNPPNYPPPSLPTVH